MEGILSQEEINALLSGGDISDEEDEKNEEENLVEAGIDNIEYESKIKFSKDEEDVIGEVGNISLGSSSTALSTLLSKEVSITTPKVKVYNYESFIKTIGKDEKVLVQIEYRTGFIGLNLLIIEKRDASIIGDLMMGNDGTNPPDELDDLNLSAVSESMNQMMESSATALAGMFSKEVDILPPKLTVTGTESIKDFSSFFIENPEFMTVAFDMEIGNLVKTKIYQVMSIDFAKNLINDMFAKMNGVSEPKSESKKAPVVKEEKIEHYKEPVREVHNESQMGYQAQNQMNSQMPTMDPMMMQQMMQQMMMMQQMQTNTNQQVNVQPAQFMNFGANKVREMHSNIDMIMDVPLQVTVELGRTKMLIKEILDLGPGSIVELDKLAGEPVDILVNNKLIAKGEVVVIDESFGVRITDIISKMERINKVQ